MKKFLMLAIALLFAFPALVLAGHTAFDNMTELDEELATLTGQIGITIDTSIEITDGYIAWTDTDGNGIDGEQGVVLLDNLRVNGPGGVGAMDMTGLTIDCATNASNTTYLVIGLPSIVGQISFENICLGENVTDARNNSLGALSIGDLNMSSSTVKISAH